MEDPCNAESGCDGYGLVHVYRLALDPQGLQSLLLRTLFSFSDMELRSLSVPYAAKALPGFFFFTAVRCTHTSSLVSFLLLKPYPFLTLNHFMFPEPSLR